MDLDVAEGPHVRGEFGACRDGQGTAETFNNSGNPPLSDPRNASSPAWWLSGLGEREIGEIAQYLGSLDEEERALSGTEAQDRWAKWMQWPPATVNNRARDVIEVLKESGKSAEVVPAQQRSYE